MKRSIAVLLLIALLVTLLAGCGTAEPLQTQMPTTEPTELTTEPTTEPPKAEEELTHQDIIDGLNDYAKERDYSFRVTDVKEIPQDDPGRTCFSFLFMDGVIEVVVWETDGIADGISVMVWPGKYKEGLSNPNEYTDEELAVVCRVLVLLPVIPCEPDMNASECLNWHDERMNETMYQDGIFLKFAYQSERWEYNISLCTLSLMLSATKETDGVQEEEPVVNAAPQKLTREQLISELNAYAEEKGFGKVTNRNTTVSEYVGMTRYEFKYMDGRVNVLLEEKDGVVEGVMAYVYLVDLPGELSETEKIATATELVMLPLMIREGTRDFDTYRAWHAGKIGENRQDYGSFWTSDYSNDYWAYRCMANSDSVMLNASSLTVNWEFADDSDGL